MLDKLNRWRPRKTMQVKYLEVLSACLLAVLKQMTTLGSARVKVQRGAPPGGGIPVAQVIEYNGRESDLRGFFVLGFPTQGMALTLANNLEAKMGLTPSKALDHDALDLLGEFLNTVVGHTISAWDRMGMPVSFGAPSALQQAQIKETDGYKNSNYLIALSFEGGGLIFSTTFSQAEAAVEARRVLVVDDSRTVRQVVEKALVSAGYEVAQSNDGAEAVEMYSVFRPALVIMDLVMPQMGGLEAIMTIREKDPEARFVILTSSQRMDEIVTAKTLGVLDYLLKPVNTARLLKVVEDATRPDGRSGSSKKSRSEI